MAVLVVILALLVLVAVVLVYAGALKWFTLKAVESSKSPAEKILVVYRPHIGEYKNCWVAFTELNVLLRLCGKSSCRQFGVYYDKPEIGKDRCRYIVGAIIAEGSEIDGNDSTREETLNFFKMNGFSQAVFPKVEKCIYASFPYRCGLLSIWLAIAIVYKAMAKALAGVMPSGTDDKRGIMEIYDPDVIHFIFPLDSPSSLQVADFFEAKAQ